MGRTKGATNKVKKSDVEKVVIDVNDDNEDFMCETTIKTFVKVGRYNISHMVESTYHLSENYEKLSNLHIFKVIDQKGEKLEKNVLTFLEIEVTTPKGKSGYSKFSAKEIGKLFNYLSDNVADIFQEKVSLSKYGQMLQDNNLDLFQKIPVKIKCASYECNQ